MRLVNRVVIKFGFKNGVYVVGTIFDQYEVKLSGRGQVGTHRSCPLHKHEADVPHKRERSP